MRKWSEAEILEGVNINDQEAVKQLFDMYWALLKLLTIELIGKELPDKNIPDSVFVKLLREPHRFKSFRSLQDFLYSSVRSECLKHIRQHPTQFNMFAEKKIKKDADRYIFKIEVLRLMRLRQQEGI